MARAKKDLKGSIEQQIMDMLDSKEEPSEGRMKLLALGLKMCALNAKLEETEYGDFFNDDDPTGGRAGGVPKGPESASRKRANGSGAGDAAG